MPMPIPFPLVPGHEIAGVVSKVRIDSMYITGYKNGYACFMVASVANLLSNCRPSIMSELLSFFSRLARTSRTSRWVTTRASGASSTLALIASGWAGAVVLHPFSRIYSRSKDNLNLNHFNNLTI